MGNKVGNKVEERSKYGVPRWGLVGDDVGWEVSNERLQPLAAGTDVDFFFFL
jgi:hypothetical protein